MLMRAFVKIASIAVILISFNVKNAFCGPAAEEAGRYLLKNGLTVLIEESRKSPLVAIEARIKTGSATEQGYLGSGISHFVEHMLFKGTPKWPGPGDIEREIKSVGGYINAFTSHDSTGVDIIVPSKYANKALEILKSILTESLFDPDELEKERAVILKEVRLDNDEPARYLSILLWSNMFKAHNYRFPVIGYEGIFKKLKREDLLNYYKSNYIPDNTVLAVVGDIDREEAFKTIDDLFGAIDRVSPPQAYYAQEEPQASELDAEEERDVLLAYISMGFHSVSVKDKDMFSLDVLSMLLGSGEDSRLYKKLYKEKKIVLSVGSFDYTPRSPGIFEINAVLKKENIKTALDEIWKQIDAVKTNMVSDKELGKARNCVLSGYVFSRQTVQDKASDLAGNEAIIGDYDFSRKYVAGINTVTKESVMAAAQKYLKRENLTVIKLVPREVKKPPEKKETAAGGLLSNLEKFELSNGMKVLILQDRSLPIVSINAIGIGGLRTENFKNNGISNLVSDTLLCGTKNRSEEEIFSQTESAGASMDSSSGSNTFSISASGLSGDFGLLAGIFSDALENPLFAPDKIEREIAAIKDGIKGIDDDIYQSGMRTVKYTLFKSHPYRFPATGRIATISGLSRPEVLDYYRTYYCPGNIVLSVSGDVDKKAAKETIAGLFEKFEKRPLPKVRPPQEKRRTAPRILTRLTQKEQSLILLGYLGANIYNHDKYALQVLSSVLSGVNGRLSKTIREEKGLAYTLDAVSAPGIDTGMIIFYAATTSENLETAKDALLKEISRLKKEGISAEELKSSRRELIGLHQMGLQKIRDIALTASVDELYGLGVDNLLKYEDRINHITKECVVRAARKYLGDNSYVLFMIKGAK